MKTIYKVGISLALASLLLLLMSPPFSPISDLGEQIFGTYQRYLSTLLSVFGGSVIGMGIVFIWREL